MVKDLEEATLAGGCFWCTEAIFKRLSFFQHSFYYSLCNSFVKRRRNDFLRSWVFNQICQAVGGSASFIFSVILGAVVGVVIIYAVLARMVRNAQSVTVLAAAV